MVTARRKRVSSGRVIASTECTASATIFRRLVFPGTIPAALLDTSTEI